MSESDQVSPAQSILQLGTCPCPECSYELLPTLGDALDGVLICSECGHRTTIRERCAVLTTGRFPERQMPWHEIALPSVLLMVYVLILIAAQMRQVEFTIPVVLGGLLILTMRISSRGVPGPRTGIPIADTVAGRTATLLVVNVVLSCALLATLVLTLGVLVFVVL